MNLVDKTTVLRTIGYIIAICIIQMYYSLHYHRRKLLLGPGAQALPPLL